MKRVRLSQKVFLLFFSLTAMTFIVAFIVHTSLDVFQNSGKKIQILNDFHIQVKTLELFHHHEHLKALQNSNSFDAEIDRTRKLAEVIGGFHSNLAPALKRQLATLVASIDYYREAYLELREKYAYDLRFTLTEPTFSMDHLSSHLPETEKDNEEIHEILDKLISLRIQAYHTRKLLNIRAMKQLARRLSSLSGDTQLLSNVSRFVLDTEKNYINYLAIQNRKNFLHDTSSRFTRISTVTIALIAEAYQKNRMQLHRTVSVLLILSVLLTVTLWFFVSRYFNRFLFGQKKAIAAIKMANYDYEVPPVSNDEIGDLAGFMKELTLNIKASEKFFADTLNNLPSFLFVLKLDGTLIFANTRSAA